MPVISYGDIFKPSRFRTSSKTGRTIVDESASDYSRILYSSPFRRLQQKAQVFSLESDAAVRSRLTHSLEVAEVGRRISGIVAQELWRRERLQPEDYFSFSQFTETACLMHDMGNPPFGHFGEIAIQDWFSKAGKECFCQACNHDFDEDELWERVAADFKEFDGNPQCMRIVMKLQRNAGDEWGLNLTYTQLLSGLKYVRSAGETESGPATKKPGYFQTEKDRIRQIWNELPWDAHKRFPIAYVMEAADDIAYCLSDIDDGIQKGIVCEQEFFDAVSAEAAACEIETGNMLYFKTGFMERMIRHSAAAYIENEEELFCGEVCTLIEGGAPEGALLKKIKQFSRNHLYRSCEAEEIEVSGYHIIYGLLNIFSPLLECSMDSFGRLVSRRAEMIAGNKLDVQWRLFNRLPTKYVATYENDLENLQIEGLSLSDCEWLFRAHLLLDYISGMTDHYALEIYRKFTGISLD